VSKTLILIAFILGLLASECFAQQPGTAEVATDHSAYVFAKREAELQASRGVVGHLLGIAPGCRFAGVGSSGSVQQPNHCTSRKHVLVGRAFAISSNGKVYWSAQYR
jgi:hypothetical protein